MNGGRIISGLCEVRARQALVAALAEYDRAMLGRLNVTADALRESAKECGWAWNAEPHGLVAWVRHYLDATPNPLTQGE